MSNYPKEKLQKLNIWSIYFYYSTFTVILDFTVGRRSPPNNPKSIEELDISG